MIKYIHIYEYLLPIIEQNNVIFNDYYKPFYFLKITLVYIFFYPKFESLECFNIKNKK